MQKSKKNKRGTDAERNNYMCRYDTRINVPCPRTTHERLVSRKKTSRGVDLIVIASFVLFVVGVLTS